jgi:hypothetical protein
MHSTTSAFHIATGFLPSRQGTAAFWAVATLCLLLLLECTVAPSPRDDPCASEDERSVTVYELRNLLHTGKVSDGDTVIVRGEGYLSEYASFFLLDSELEYPLDYWQGLHIEELTCEVDGATATCRPFDPTGAELFRFKGSLRVHQWGKMTSLALTDVDFERSCRSVGEEWQLLPLGTYTVAWQTSEP